VDYEITEELIMKSLYLMLAIVGAVVPYGFFFGFIAAEGLNLSGFVSALFANGPAGGFTADLLISSVYVQPPRRYVHPPRRSKTLAVHSAEPDHWAVLCASGLSLCYDLC
jgi:hypothetical protein